MSKANPVVDIVSILNNPKAKAILTNHIDEALIEKRSIRDKNENIKVIREAAMEKTGIEAKMFNSLLALYFKGNFDEKHQELGQLESAIEMLTGTTFGAPDQQAQFDQDDIDGDE